MTGYDDGIDVTGSLPPETANTAAHSLRIGDLGAMPVHAAEPVRGAWRQELALLGGRSPLLHFEDSPATRIELSTTHPGGLAQFITGHRTLLSNLIRDELALRAARGAAQELTAKAIELATARGIDAVQLAVGIAEWRHDGRDYRGPVLLRPLAIRRYGRDFELRLKGAPILNPALARALEQQFQISIDPDSFARLAIGQGEFRPQAVIDRLRGLTTHLSWFSVQPRLLVSAFAEVAPALARDAGQLEHPLLDALAGIPAARARLGERQVAVEPPDTDRLPVAADALILDADATQARIVAELAAGNSIAVHAVPGSGVTQTVANATAALVAQHKRVLVVSPRRASLQGLAARLAQVGLDGLGVGPGGLGRDLVRAILRNERAERPSGAEADAALQRLRGVLLDYRHALEQRDRVLGVSVLDALSELSKLALLPEPPATTARLSETGVAALATGRQEAAELLRAAAELGEFRYGPSDSAWYGAEFASPEDAARAQLLAQRLHEEFVPGLLAHAVEVVGQTSMRPPSSVAETGAYLELMLQVRDTLDRFTPDVYDRPLTELIVATSPRKDAAQSMSSGDRRRLRRLAEEYLRPGARVDDLHRRLQQIQQQRSLWQRYSQPGLTPQVPTGIHELERRYRDTVDALAVVEAAVQPAGGGGMPLAELSFQQLQGMLAGLAVQTEAMTNLQERTELVARLRSLDLAPLLRDLADRHVSGDRVALELELAWWQTALQQLLSGNRALLNANTEVVDRLEADFRLVDEAHVGTNAGLLAWQLAQSWAIGIADHPDEAATLRAALKAGPLTPAGLQEHAPTLGRILAPVWLASPYEVPQLPEGLRFDAVLLLDAAAVTLAECVPAIRRAQQVAAFGDPVSEAPSRFQLALSERPFDGGAPELVAESALLRLGELLPVHRMLRSYRAAGQDLTDLVSRHCYEGVIESLPWAGQYLGHSSFSFVQVEGGTAMPDPVSGSVESVDAEVERVVQLVLEHAERSPGQSLMVITASARHAVRLEQAVLAGFSRRTDLGEFLLSEHSEPFLVATMEQAVGQARDRVIFSVGYGRTPHGRLLSAFGPLGEEGGERALAHALTRARRSLTIVSCFGPDEIDEHRMRHGVLSLAQVLKEAARHEPEEPLLDDSDPLLADLAQRLTPFGVRVGLGYRERLGLVASYGGRAAVIETEQALLGQPLREALRLRPQQLHRLGWHYLRVHAFELFRDPDAVALRIARALGAAPAAAMPADLDATLPVERRRSAS